MLTPAQEGQLFDYLCRHRPLREWLEDQRQTQVKTLVTAVDIELVRRAQGQVQFLDRMLDKLDAAESAAKQR